MIQLETYLRMQNEPLTYGLFFGGLALFGVIETFAALRATGAIRWRRWPVNFGLTLINIAVMSLLPVSALIAADYAREGGHGWLNQNPHSIALLVIVGFLARSLASWSIHWLMHNVPVLWRVHRVHHTDTHFDISTTVRFHPLEFLIAAPILVATVVVLGLPPEVIILYELFDTAMAVFTHANIRMPVVIERALNWVLVTPDLHRIHHSTRVKETNSNYGATLVLWDRVFGTFQRKTPEELAVQPLGLTETQDKRASSLIYLMTLPFRPSRIRRPMRNTVKDVDQAE